jgi:hypothetical protein
VKLKNGFAYGAWIEGLNQGRSFVTTGPMLFVKINGLDPGHTFSRAAQPWRTYSVAGTTESAYRKTTQKSSCKMQK